MIEAQMTLTSAKTNPLPALVFQAQVFFHNSTGHKKRHAPWFDYLQDIQ